MNARLAAALTRLPLIAIMRGIKPDEAVGTGEALAACGFTMIEVPLNSPDPLASIETLRKTLRAEILVGAGTVTSIRDVADAKAAGMIALPGVATPTEAFAALAAGADGLKLFPAELITPPVLKAMLAVLPKGTVTLPVGGVTPEGMRPYIEAGAKGFGLGSALYKPGMSAADVTERARLFVAALPASLRAS
jgi:2-dehydro-3-deoxyphosphogalactonate aldolase